MCDELIDFPELIEFNDFGDYHEYEKALLEIYERDLWKGNLTFNSLNVKPRVHKKFEISGRSLDWTFAHFTSKGPVDDDRELDLTRCERMGFIKPILDNAHLDCVKVWENSRLNKKNQPVVSVVLWCECVNIKLVITRYKDYYVITTFYLIRGEHKIKKHEEEYAQYVKLNGKYIVNEPVKKQ